jgi:hypothetical protein
MLNRCTRLALASLSSVALVMAVAANPVSAANTFGSCDDLHSKYPSGVAKNKKAARLRIRGPQSQCSPLQDPLQGSRP